MPVVHSFFVPCGVPIFFQKSRYRVIFFFFCQSFLSGMPELKLGLNDKLLFESSGRSSGTKKAVELEDIKFHQ